MVSLSLTISISRNSSDQAAAHPYQGSVYSTHSRSNSQTYSTYGHPVVRSNSLEQLLKPKRVRIENRHLNGAKGRRMAGNGGGAMKIEPRKSYGIGGAGNIRRPSEVIYPLDGSRRRSSVWSSKTVSPGSSPDGRRGIIMGLFKKNSVTVDEPALGFNRIDLSDDKIDQKED